MGVPKDGALYFYENVGLGSAPAPNGALYLYENVGLGEAPTGLGALYLYENVGLGEAPGAGALYFYENALDDGHRQFFHFQLRADTASGAADTTTVNVKWVVGGVTHDLGNFDSFQATATGDAPWRDIAVPVDGIYDSTKTNRAEVQQLGTSANLLTTNQWGLEYGTTSGWRNMPDPSLGTTYTNIQASTAHAYSGSYSLLASVTAAIDRYFATTGGIDGFPVVPGATYSISARVWREELGDIVEAVGNIIWYDVTGAELSRTTSGQHRKDLRNQWNDFWWGLFTAPAGAAFGAVYLNTALNNNLFINLWFDEIGVYRTSTLAPIFGSPAGQDNTHIRNTWLELTTTSSTNLLSLAQWGAEGGTVSGWTALDDGQIHARNDFAAAEGTYYFAIAHVTGVGGVSAITPAGTAGFPVVSGATYHISYYGKTDSGGGLRPAMHWYTSAGALISVVQGWETWGLPQPDWGPCFGGNLTAPPDAAFGALEMSMTHIDVNGERVWFDKVGVYQLSSATPYFEAPAGVVSKDYGSYPKGFDYIEDVEDGILYNGSEVLHFDYNGSYTAYVVPPTITSLDIECWGAQGGDTGRFPGTNLAGRGGYIKSRVAVTPGETLRVYVGSAGSNSGVGGFNGGGTGGFISGGQAGGGGATDVRRAPYGLADRLVVAAGGGGAPGGTASSGASSGNGGSNTGQTGAGGYFGATGGSGGTQTAGGAAGTSFSGCAFLVLAQAGSFGAGGNGASGPGCLGQGTGGGGGGWYGGGGGGLEGSYGGGGSSYAVGVISSNTQGVRSGNGTATITRVPVVIMNDGGTLPDAAYYVEQGPSVPASPYNYHIDFNGQPGGTLLNGYDGWTCDPHWYFDGGGWVVLENQSHGHGLFNAYNHSLVLRSDGLHSAPKHHIVAYESYYGSRGSNGEGAVWGYRDANNYWFAIPNSDSGLGRIGRVSGGVITNIAPLNCDSWVEITVDHDFRTGFLKVDTFEPFLGATTHYSGVQPWSVVNGKVGFLGMPQNGGAFWTAALFGNFTLDYGDGSIEYSKQYSMQTNAVVTQSPATWYFKATKIAKWVVGAVGWS